MLKDKMVKEVLTSLWVKTRLPRNAESNPLVSAVVGRTRKSEKEMLIAATMIQATQYSESHVYSG